MKILRVVSSLNASSGGVAETVRLTSRHLTWLGNQVEVVCLDENLLNHIQESTFVVHSLGPAIGIFGFSPRLVGWLNKNICRFDVVIIEGLWQFHGIAVKFISSIHGVPYYVYIHGMLDPWFKITYPIKHFKKSIYWLIFEYHVLRGARKVLFTCEEEQVLSRGSFWPYRVNEDISSLGVEAAPANDLILKERFLNRHPRLKGKRIILYLSRIHEKKGCDLLIDAFAIVAKSDINLQLMFAGPDQTNWVPTLKAQAVACGVADKIIWPGMLLGDDKWGAFYAAEVFCLPSHQENFGIVVAEALACGKPVLISNKVNIWREIASDAAGFVDTDTTEGTVRNLRRWLALDGDAYAAMCERARQCFATRFHIERAAQRLLEIIREQR